MLTIIMSMLKSLWLEHVNKEGKVMYATRQSKALDRQRPEGNGEILPITETIRVLKEVMALRDFETASHIERLGFYSYRLSHELQMDKAFCESIYYAS